MTFGGDCLIQKLNDRIVALESSFYGAAQISGALNSVETYYCVPCIASLPNASCNKGRFVYVEDIKSFRYSDGYYWTKDACSVLGNENTTGSLWTWGNNGGGRLGDGTTVLRGSPGTVAGGGTTWCQVSGACCHTAAIKTDGTLWTWGVGGSGRLGDGTTITRCSPGTVAGGGTTWRLISINASLGSAIKTDGTLWTWGINNCGQLGDGTTITRCSPGTIAGGGTTWSQISTGDYGGSAIKTDGTLWTWGINGSSGILGDGTTVDRCSPGTTAGGGTTWCRVSNGRQQIMAIKTDGTLWTWGCNSFGQLGDGTTVSRCSPGTIAGGGTTWCQVCITSSTTSAIKTDGTLWTWGLNNCGQLGDGTVIGRCSPGTIAGSGTIWCQVSSGNCNISAIKTDGTLWTWGLNNSGQLGDETVIGRCSPGTIAGGGITWCQVSNGDRHTVAIKSRGF